jgi:outer membrane protein assembly factor BamA
LLLLASEAETGGMLSLRGDMPFLRGFGYRVEGFVLNDKPRFFDGEGDTINRAHFDRRGLDAVLQVSLERWGLVEAGLRIGSVENNPQAGIDLPPLTDDNRMFIAGVVVDDLDALLWPESGFRLAAQGWWNAEGLGASRPFWRVRGEARLGQQLGRRTVLQLDALAGLSGDDMPVYDWFRIGGPYLLPGYSFEELKGRQAVAGSVSLRYRVVHQLRVLARFGAGNVYERRNDIRFDDLRWGVGVGLMYPSKIGPLAVELGWRDGGASLLTASFGWN